jgi:uncharacterized spore protein YtfJ
MGLNQLFDVIEKMRQTAHWRAAFGEPQAIEGRTIIPVARVTYGFGLGFGRGTGPSEAEDEPMPEGEGGGGGGAAMANPLGAIVVTPEGVDFEGTVDATKVALVGSLVGALFIYQVAKTVRAISGRE